MIRAFRKNDIHQIMKLWLETNVSTHHFIPKEYWIGMYDAVKESMPSASIYVYEENGIVYGFIGLMDQYIAGIFVESEMQEKGIGKQLIEYVKANTEELALHVYQKNCRAMHFYEREKFVIVSQQVDEDTGEIELLMSWKRNHAD